MKKIIATVLAMVMALALCTTAFAAGFIGADMAGATAAASRLCQLQTGPDGLCGENCTPCAAARSAIRSISQGPPQYFTSGMTTSYRPSSNRV